MTDVLGAEQARYSYYPYGEIFSPHPLPSPQRGEGWGEGALSSLFTGQKFDFASNLYYYGSRYYDPSLGKFISPDPLRNGDLPQDLNLYSYAWNNPLRVVDPSGMSEEEGWFQRLGKGLSAEIKNTEEALKEAKTGYLGVYDDMKGRVNMFSLGEYYKMKDGEISIREYERNKTIAERFLKEEGLAVEAFGEFANEGGDYITFANQMNRYRAERNRLGKETLKLSLKLEGLSSAQKSLRWAGKILGNKNVQKIGIFSTAFTVTMMASDLYASENPTEAAEIIDQYLKQEVLGPFESPLNMVIEGANWSFGNSDSIDLKVGKYLDKNFPDPHSSDDWSPYLDSFSSEGE
ncbi:MAG: RHS repeat-associated core domain-containing protein [Deltaproteobacteria bacterium]|nr:RHS repeat-associated core domain-containing protein [Deltaproteobacteria bacterium]